MELFAGRDGRLEDFHANAAEELFVNIVDEQLLRKAHGHEAIAAVALGARQSQRYVWYSNER